MGSIEAKGLLSIEVKAAPIIAGTSTTVTLIIRNPFADLVIIESIQAPSSAPLLPSKVDENRTAPKKGIFRRMMGVISDEFEQEFSRQLTANFPTQSGPRVPAKMEPHSKLTVENFTGPSDKVEKNNADSAEVVADVPDDKEILKKDKARVIQAHQEDLASFELKTAHWLLVKPKILELHALIRFSVNGEPRSQVVPVMLTIQPPVTSVLCGAVLGSVLGWLARQFNEQANLHGLFTTTSILGFIGIIVMAMILAIVLSRQELSKGFVTLEDFYGAFVVGAILGYSGTQYFEQSFKAVAGSSPQGN